MPTHSRLAVYLLTVTGIQREDFSVPLSLGDVKGVQTFVAREKELADIHLALQGDGIRREVVLHGLGGIGKTQLAISYAKRFSNSYSAVFWLNIQDETSVKQSFARNREADPQCASSSAPSR